MNKIVALVLAIASVSGVFAQAQTQAVQAGVTPDSFLYGLDVAIDRISLLLTFDKGEKAKKGLEIARERLLEVKAMIEENKLDAAQEAQRGHEFFLNSVKNSVKELERTNSTTEIEEEIEIEKELEEYESEVENVAGELEIEIKVKGEQKMLIDSVLAGMQNATGEVKIEISNKKRETKIKIEQETGKSEEEIEEEIEKLEREKGLAAVKEEKARERIKDAREEIAELEEIAKTNTSNVTVLLEEARKHIEKAEAAYKEGKYGEAFGQATAAEHIAEGAMEKIEKLSIEAEIENGTAKIEVEINGSEEEFTLQTTNKEEIVTEIANRTGLTKEEIEKNIKFEVKLGRQEKEEKASKGKEKEEKASKGKD